MRIKKKIRPTALLAVAKNNKILVIKGYDYYKGEDFYRLIGGGIEFGETGIQALRREVKEEIKARIKNIKYLGLVENIFNFEGHDRHEVVLIYQADFNDKKIYKKKEIKIFGSHQPQKAYWLDKKILFKSKFYPKKLRKLI